MTQTHFKPNDSAPEQEISDHNLIDQMDPCYEMLAPILSSDGQGMAAIRSTTAYLRNEQGQRKYSKDPKQVVPFVVTREYQPGGIVIYHFYVAGVRMYATDMIKAENKEIKRRSPVRA